MGILRRQGIKSAIAIYIGVAIGYVNIILLFPRFLLPDQLGLTRVMIAVALIFSQIALLGSPYALIRFFPYFNNKEQKHYGFPALIFRIAILGFAGVGVLFFILKNFVEQLYEKNSPLFSEYYSVVFPLAFFMLVTELAFNYCRSLLKLPIPVFIKEVMLRLFQTAALVLFITHLVNFEGFVFLFIGSYMLQMLLMIGYVCYLKEFFFFSKIQLEGKVSLRQILRFSLFSFAAASVAIYTANIDTVLLGLLASLESVAIYNVAFFIGTVIQIPARSMNAIASALVADAWRYDDQKKFRNSTRRLRLTS